MDHLNIPFAERDLVFDIARYLDSPHGVEGKMRKSRNGHLVVLFQAKDLTHDYPTLQWLNTTEKDTDNALKMLQAELQSLEIQNFLRLTAFGEDEQKTLKKQLTQHKMELYFIPYKPQAVAPPEQATWEDLGFERLDKLAQTEVAKQPESNWVMLEYLDADGQVVVGARYELTDPSGTVIASGQIARGDGPTRVTLPSSVTQVQARFFGGPDATPKSEVQTVVKPVVVDEPEWWEDISGTLGRLWDDTVDAADWCWGVVQGDFNTNPTVGQIITNAIITAIPVVDQVADVRDIIASLKQLAWDKKYDDSGVWVGLLLTTIGLVPVLGSLLKGVLKLVWHGAKLDELLKVFNHFMKGDGIKWLTQLKNGKLHEHSRYAADQTIKVITSVVDKLKGLQAYVPSKLKQVSADLQGIIDNLNTVKAQVNGKFEHAADQMAEKLGKILATKTDATASGATKGTLTAQQGKAPPPAHQAANDEIDLTKRSDNDVLESGETSKVDNQTPKNESGEANSPSCGKENGCPISMITGEEVLSQTDFVVPGPVPLNWTRTYRSHNQSDQGLGFKWHHPLSERLVVDAEQVHFTHRSGQTFRLPKPTAIGEHATNTTEQYCVRWRDVKHWVIEVPGEAVRVFQVLPETPKNADTFICRLVRLENQAGYGWRLRYQRSFDDEPVPTFATRLISDWGTCLKVYHHNDHITSINRETRDGKLLSTLVRYTIDEHDDLRTALDAEGFGERYQYNNHIFIQRQFKSGFSITFEWDRYDHLGRCVRQWGDQQIYHYQFEWAPDQASSVAVDSRGGRMRYRYNDNGQITEEVSPKGHRTRYEYNALGKRTSVIDPLGRRQRILYDDQGRVRTLIAANGEQRLYTYNDQGLLATENLPGTQPDERVLWQYRYNDQQQVSQLIGPNDVTVDYEYNEQGLLAAVHHSTQGSQLYRWNEQGQLNAEIDPKGLLTQYTYDELDHITSVSVAAIPDSPEATKKLDTAEPLEALSTTQYAYDKRGLVTKITKAEGSINLDYDAAGQLVRYSDVAGFITRFEYGDGLSQVTKRINPDGSELRYEYDLERNLIAIVNENSDRYRFRYDGDENLISEDGFDGRRQRYHYNAAGELIRHQDSGISNSTFERDPLGRLVRKNSRILQQPDVPDDITDYRYDGLGRLFAAQNPDAFVRFDYDAEGNLSDEWLYRLHPDMESVEDLGDPEVLRHRYDSQHRRIATDLPDGRTLDYRFGQQGLADVSLNQQSIASFERDRLGRELTRQQGALNTAFDYDIQGRLQQQKVQHAEQKHAVIERNYRYNRLGQLTHKDDNLRGDLRYHYDAKEQLEKVEGYQHAQFAFDPAGNLLQAQQGQPDNSAQHSNHEHTNHLHQYRGNRLIRCGDTTFHYDAAGNLKKKVTMPSRQALRDPNANKRLSTTTYSYNADHQLIEVKQDGQETRYRYDPLGRRIFKLDNEGSTRFLWSGDQLIQERRGEKRKLYIYEPISYRPLALVEHETDFDPDTNDIDSSQVYHYHLDHLGTPQELTNAEGDIVWQANYHTYGEVAEFSTKQIENNLRFQGQYYDAESGLHYNRHRYYDPEVGRFIHQDPIGLLGGDNLYRYAPNPVGWVDPLGLTGKEPDCLIFPDSAVEHSNVGEFPNPGNPKKNPHPSKMLSGGHGQANIEYLEEIGMEYNVVHEFDNGVRVGNVPDHKSKLKKRGTGQSWFPEEWSESDIRAAGNSVIRNTPNFDSIPDGQVTYGNFNGIRVGVIKTHGQPATVFPDGNQQP